jgi:hypothetical protein
MFCAREQIDVPRTLLRYVEAWGWVHATDEGTHTVAGDQVEDGTERKGQGRLSDSGTPTG